MSQQDFNRNMSFLQMLSFSIFSYETAQSAETYVLRQGSEGDQGWPGRLWNRELPCDLHAGRAMKKLLRPLAPVSVAEHPSHDFHASNAGQRSPGLREYAPAAGYPDFVSATQPQIEQQADVSSSHSTNQRQGGKGDQGWPGRRWIGNRLAISTQGGS
jgi:hypothetical protein